MRAKPKKFSLERQLDSALVSCARKGLLLTALREQVLRIILEADGPMTAYQVLARLQETRPKAAAPTAYRVLDFLVAQQLIHRLEKLNAFVACCDAGHQHAGAVQFLICERCGGVTELEDARVGSALDEAARTRGFQPETISVEISGTCAACAVEPRRGSVPGP